MDRAACPCSKARKEAAAARSRRVGRNDPGDKSDDAATEKGRANKKWQLLPMGVLESSWRETTEWRCSGRTVPGAASLELSECTWIG